MAEGKYVGGSPFLNNYYAGDPVKKGFRKETSEIPLLVGTVFGEFTSFSPAPFDKRTLDAEEAKAVAAQILGKEGAEKVIPLFEKAYPKRHLIDLLNLDFVFRGATQEYIRQRSMLNQSTYSYLFNQDMPIEGGRTPWHCADIPYVFHNTELVANTQEHGVTEKLESQIFECVMAFARTGNPNHKDIPTWPASTPKEENTMVFDKNTRLLCNYDRELIPIFAKYIEPVFWKKHEENAEEIQH